MKTKLCALIFCSAFASGVSQAADAPAGGAPTLIVAPFKGNTTHIQYWQPAMGAGLAEMLITELGRMNKFQVLETTKLETLKDEVKLGEDGWVGAAEKVEKGGWAGADFMFTGEVTQFGAKTTGVNLGGFVPGNLGNLGVKQNVSNVRIDWRLVDAFNRKVIKTGSSVGEQKGTSFNVGVNIGGSGGKIGFDNKEFMDSALGKATVLALSNITSELGMVPLPDSGRSRQKSAAADKETAAMEALKMTPGKVLAAPGSSAIVVSLGKKQGFKDGDKLNLYETNDVKDDKGEVVFSEEKLVGEITLKTVQEDRSLATYSGNLTIKAGWVVKVK